MNRIWTVGHSNHSWAQFEALLRSADVEAVADIRSSPSSRHAHFNRAALSAKLATCDVAYIFLGRELGGRSEDGWPLDYEERTNARLFREGLARVEAIAQRSRLVLMCAEHEPLECHRCLLVGRRLKERGVEVEHILRDGGIERHAETEERLLKLTRRREADFFASRAQRLERAYGQWASKIQSSSRRK